MPGAAWLRTCGFNPISQSLAKLVAPASDCFIRDHDATLEQQLLDIAQAQVEPEVPANGATDDDSGSGGRDKAISPRELTISTAMNEPGAVQVTVCDSGPGIAPENIEHLFEPFYTTKASGMGMGLSICRSIIEAHGGRLEASANVPRGAIFQFTVSVPPAVSS